ncbi:leucine-rich colipase-like protein 1 [Eleutherodactylus coqui]|uniref:leucine-rich colipase-like protein 1 n=1 Tax=Eleutherodactylus coqui TaxID=57060 RepID=UPI00346320EE
MAQHSIMSILLFVCLSLCFEVAQSQLEPFANQCTRSSDCRSRCCFRFLGVGLCVPRDLPDLSCIGLDIGDECSNNSECKSGCCGIRIQDSIAKCIPKRGPNTKCIGPNDGDSCYSSDLCNSGCCFRSTSREAAAECGPKRHPQECLGPDNGDFCSLSAECDSGCCRRTSTEFRVPTNKCEPKAAKNATCNPLIINGLYPDYCPCARGLTCQLDRNDRYFCK